MPLKDRALVQAEIEVDGDTFGVEVHGELAERLAGMEPGSTVRITGRLKRYQWEARNKQPRERVVVLAEQVSQIYRPEKRIGDARPGVA